MTRSLMERVRDLLRAEAKPSVPISRLYHALADQAEGEIRSYGQLRERLRRHPELFELLEPAGLPWDTASWPEEARVEYERALRQIGAVAEPRVALRTTTPPAPPHDGPESGAATVLRRLDLTLVHLWEETDDEAEERSAILDAMARADALRAVLERVTNDQTPWVDHAPTGRP
jgi:hypothetical protein